MVAGVARLPRRDIGGPCRGGRIAPWSGSLRWCAGGDAGLQRFRAGLGVETTRWTAPLWRGVQRELPRNGWPIAARAPSPASNVGSTPGGERAFRPCPAPGRSFAAPRHGGGDRLTAAGKEFNRGGASSGAPDADYRVHDARSAPHLNRCSAPWVRPAGLSSDGCGQRAAVAGHAISPVSSAVGSAAPPCKPFPPPLSRLEGARAGGASEFRTE
jgi:hypothetical protein